jgi:hypothetical protein
VSTPSPHNLRLIWTRSLRALDAQSLEFREVKEALFRDDDRFILYLTDGSASGSGEERLISLSSREALLWLNENQTEAGSFWE